jgi:splicing factor 3B subunit 3
LVKFNAQPEAQFCLIGVAKDYRLNPRNCNGGFVYAYKIVSSPNGLPSLELVHKTSVDEIPYAMCPFQGKVLIGVGKLLRLYDLGKKKMLRKSENKVRKTFHLQLKTSSGAKVAVVRESHKLFLSLTGKFA